MLTNKNRSLSVIEHQPQSVVESSIIKVDSSQFPKIPLTPFDTCLNLINGLLNFLKVFADKTKPGIDDHITQIITHLMSKPVGDTYNSTGGLFGMADSTWIKLTIESKIELSKLGLMGPPFTNKFFQIDAVNQFIKLFVKDKYKIPSTVAEAASQALTVPQALVAVVYQLIEFNSLPPMARLYNELHNKNKVSATDLQTQTLAASLEANVDLLIKAKGKTRQTSQIIKASAILNSQGKVISAAYDLFKKEHNRQLKEFIPDPQTPPPQYVEAATIQTDMVEQEKISEIVNVKGEVPIINEKTTTPEVVAVSAKEQSIHPSVIVENKADPIQPVPITYDKDFVDRVFASLADYYKDNLPTVLSDRLVISVSEIQKVIATKEQNLIDEKLKTFKAQIYRIIEFKNDSSPALFSRNNLQAILIKNFANRTIDPNAESLKMSNTK